MNMMNAAMLECAAQYGRFPKRTAVDDIMIDLRIEVAQLRRAARDRDRHVNGWNAMRVIGCGDFDFEDLKYHNQWKEMQP